MISNSAPYLQLVSTSDVPGNAHALRAGERGLDVPAATTRSRMSKHIDQHIVGIFEGTEEHIAATLLQNLPGMPVAADTTPGHETWSVTYTDRSLLTVTCPDDAGSAIKLYCLFSDTTSEETTITFAPDAEYRSMWRRTRQEEFAQQRCQALAAQVTSILCRHSYSLIELRSGQARGGRAALHLAQ